VAVVGRGSDLSDPSSSQSNLFKALRGLRERKQAVLGSFGAPVFTFDVNNICSLAKALIDSFFSVLR